MDITDISPAKLSAFFTTEAGRRVMAVARGELPVSAIMEMPRDELDMARTLLIFWNKAKEHL